MKRSLRVTIAALMMVASALAVGGPAQAHDPLDQTETTLSTAADFPAGSTCWDDAFSGVNTCAVLDADDVLECEVASPTDCVLHDDGDTTTPCATSSTTVSGNRVVVEIAYPDVLCDEWKINELAVTNQLWAYLAVAVENGRLYSVSADGSSELVRSSSDEGQMLSAPMAAGASYQWTFEASFNDGQCEDADVDVVAFIILNRADNAETYYVERDLVETIPCQGWAQYQTIFDLTGEQGVTVTHGNVMRLYWAVFNRAPDVPGAEYWIDQVNSCTTIQGIAAFFAASPEFDERYPGGLTNDEFVTLIYNNVLNRNADSGGQTYWVGLLDDGVSRADVILAVSASPEFVARVPMQSDSKPDGACA